MVKNSIIPILVFIHFMPTYGQDKNLVLNYSFEDFKECPEDYTPMDLSHKLIPDWTYPTHATPDFFNRCSSGIVGVPKNFAGEAEPKTGSGYVGAILSGTSESYREYIQGELRVPMVAGKQYCVTYYYRLASYSQIAVDQVSMYFSNDEIAQEGKEALASLKPQIKNKDGLFLDNINEWQQICQVYVAKGEEKFFTVGNFNNYEKTNYVVVDKNVVNLRNKAYAYYYFDDFIIQPLEDCNDCPCVKKDFEVALKDTFYTGGLNPLTGKIDKKQNDGRISLSILGGTPPYNVTWSNGAKGEALNNLPAGTYTYRANDKFNCLSTGTVTFTKPIVKEDEFIDDFMDIEEGAAIVLENIFFEFNKTDLLPKSFSELDKVIEIVRKNKIQKIEISGHTDSEGSDAYNKKLSEGRAKSVVSYLSSKGIDPTTLLAVGYGESRPIDTNTTDDGKANNRRVEFKVLKK